MIRTSAILAAALLAAGRVHAQAGESPRAPVPVVTTLGLEYSRVSFRRDFTPWQFVTAEASRRGGRGTITARLNHASRFGATGTQVEAESYPRLWGGAHAYASVAYSGSDIFPAWRSGAELFQSLPHAYEASFGYRQLRFGGVPTTLLTGSVGRYVRNEWYSLRPFVHTSGSGTSASLGLTARRYFEDGDHYLGARVSYGSAPRDHLAIDRAGLTRTRSFSVAVNGSGDLFSPGVLGTVSVGYEDEALTATRTRQGFTTSAGIRVRLR